MNMAVQTPLTEDQSIENEIVRKGKIAARITPADIEAAISSEHYFTAEDGMAGAFRTVGAPDGFWIAVRNGSIQIPPSLELLTFCVLVLKNGFTVTGESACASPENFDEEIGRKIARQNAVQKIWPLMGYALKDRLSKGE
ncbi:Gp49 family protein [Paraburkholderia sp. HD33-4]|uniref:Gp49 family protein n=1 Tax=Paraburkholderia sp. HD33-4 TaxID=2883242 RepID=UPI001EEDB9BF|nr:Gp49 family protein [Paraburkholderia sp. HD33-4]